MKKRGEVIGLGKKGVYDYDHGDYIDDDERDRTVPPRERKKNSKRRHFRRVFCFFLVLILILSGTTGALAATLLDRMHINEKNINGNVYIDQTKLTKSSTVTNILLLGVDKRSESEKTCRSDTMILLSMDKQNRGVKVTSFMRDCWVYIPDHGYDRLNAACSYGGYQLVMDTIEYNFNINIDSYVLVDFDAFIQIVDSIGGIRLEVTEKEAQYMNETGFGEMKSGENVTLTGEEALWYARIRYLDSDFSRTSRQRKIITALLDDVKTSNPITLVQAMYESMPLIETDLTKKEMVSLSLNASLYLTEKPKEFRIPVDAGYTNATIDSKQVLKLDLEKNKKELKAFIYGK